MPAPATHHPPRTARNRSHLVLTLALALLGAAATAQGEGRAPDTPGAGRARTHLVHLTDGRVLRTPAREDQGRWIVRSGAQWLPLPRDLVTRAVPETQVLQQARRLAQEVRRAGGDPVRRVAYADWLFAEGLVTESLTELDRVLEDDPDQPDARELLESSRWPISLPPLPRGEPNDAWLEGFFAAAAPGGPAYHELAVIAMARATPIAGLVERLPAELGHRHPDRRKLAALVARRLMPGRWLERLLDRSVLDRDEDVRRAAALALDAAHQDAVVLPLLRVLDSTHPELRLHAVEALGNMSYRTAVAPLYGHLLRLDGDDSGPRAPRSHASFGGQRAVVMDYDVEVANASSVADPLVNVLAEGSVLDVAVLGAHEYPVQVERGAVRRSLGRLTGANPGRTTGAWRRWWREHGAEWEGTALQPGPPESLSGGGR